MISEPLVHLAQTVHLSCIDTNTVSKWIETRFDMTHDTKEFHQVQTMHLSCTDTKTVSKQIKMRFDMTHVT
jgi:hypothetical protein